eukprot:sb/3469185/
MCIGYCDSMFPWNTFLLQHSTPLIHPQLLEHFPPPQSTTLVHPHSSTLAYHLCIIVSLTLSLSIFNSTNTLLSLARSPSTANMSDCAAAKVMFSFFDDDGNGGITLVELKEALAGVGVKFSEEEITAFFAKYDTDKNGEIDFNEFVALSMALRTNAMSAEEDAMAKLFASIDVDGNRSLSHSEIREGIASFTGKPADDEEITKLIKQLDIDGDGEISYEEFSQNILTKIALAIKQG